MHFTHNTLPANISGQSIELLNKHLAAAIDLHGQLKQAHWNVRGPGFMAVHELFDKVAASVEAFSDLLAERAAALGGVAAGTIQVASQRTFLLPYTLHIADTHAHIFAVSAALAAFGQSLQGAIRQAADAGDATTTDILTEISRGVDQALWFIEAHAAPVNAGHAHAVSVAAD